MSALASIVAQTTKPAPTAAPRANPASGQHRPRAGSLAADVFDYCDVPRESGEVVDWLGEGARWALKDLVERGQITNLNRNGTTRSGLYVQTGRAPVHTERTAWYSPQTCPPDDGITVLLCVPGADEPVWPGYCEAGQWRYADGTPVTHTITAWSDLPAGPGARA